MRWYMPPLTLLSFSSRSLFRRGEGFFLLPPCAGVGASAGMLHVFPVRKAPSIFPEAHQFRTVRSERSCLSANSVTEIYSIFIGVFVCAIGKFVLILHTNIAIFADIGKFWGYLLSGSSFLSSSTGSEM